MMISFDVSVWMDVLVQLGIIKTERIYHIYKVKMPAGECDCFDLKE